MIGRGRPLRFVALVSAGWIGLRTMMLLPQGNTLPEAIKAIVPLRPAGERRRAQAIAPKPGSAPQPAHAPIVEAPPLPRHLAAIPGAPAVPRARPPPAAPRPVPSVLPESVPQLLPAGFQPDRVAPLPDRWSASAWLVVRPGSGLGAAPGSSQLGGSQAGFRLAWLIVPERRLAAFTRIAAPLRGKGAELSVGLEWQPVRAPVRLVGEYRLGLDGIRGGPGLGVVGGADRALGEWRLEAYAQAGALRRARPEPYADGAARVTHVVTGQGRIRAALGAGVWGAAQRGAARLDIGPSATLALPLEGQSIRLALDWRQRIAGDARPGSGAALTLGMDF